MPDGYLKNIITKYHVNQEIDVYTQYFVINPIKEQIRNWAGIYVNEIKISGSRAKGTALNITSDIDLFISVNSAYKGTLKDIYDSLYDYMINRGYKARKQNVSIGIEFNGHSIDLVPGKKYAGNTNYHSLYLNKRDSWTQTNIEQHINLVKNSGRINEIVLLKIWKNSHKLEFPSIYLELITIEALKHMSKTDCSNNFWHLLKFLSEHFVAQKIIDPSNSNNVISDDLFKYEKEAIAKKASACLNEQYWQSIVW
ncbi:nucleotidyltransferase domain-containing protein [Bacillus cereus]|uniref:SMODS domain-containing nucleotidyltransferase n=1 Tax=Bacillus cereus TaxID=1396 RepID=UPI00203CDC86|nr:nucleotidyltransferase domain-containing protein [Bacillus cereus]MCM3330160.1 nucleotidyltransferase domain-containing protein [Bacillus cereus]